MVVKFFATFRSLAGVDEEIINLPESSTVRQVLKILFHRHPGLRRKFLDGDGELFPYVHIFHHSRDQEAIVHDLDVVVQAEDILDFFPPVAGG